MKTNNNELYQLVSKLDWQLNMGVEAMVQERNNNYPDTKKEKTDKEGLSKLDTSQKIDTSFFQEEEIQDDLLKQSLDKCLTLEELKNYMLNFNKLFHKFNSILIFFKNLCRFFDSKF